ncbi:MAG: cystathionine gamma-synthase [Acidimicrobiales bacterium]|jgi:cystathionine gamma-synthase
MSTHDQDARGHEGDGRSHAQGFSTRAIHAGQEPDPLTGAVVTPIHLASTYAQQAVGEHRGFDYSRTRNPTRVSLETTIAALEGANHGFGFSSGMAAVDAVLRLLHPGDHLIIPNDAYGGTYRLVASVYAGAGVSFSPVELRSPEALRAAWRDETRLVWLETPSNPKLHVIDIEAVSRFAREHGGRCIVDNTFATPYLQLPIDLGADAVVHSSTKYLGGHSDVVGGLVVTNDEELAVHLGFVQNSAGAVPSPFDCYLVQRGLKTLEVRLARQCSNARTIADHLVANPAVAEVYYPGLASHPGHDLARRQMRDFGAMVSFTLKGGEAAALKVAAGTSIFTLAESLGAVESLIELPARMTHSSVAGSELEVDPSLIRLSVGLEDIGDLLHDLDGALTLAG